MDTQQLGNRLNESWSFLPFSPSDSRPVGGQVMRELAAFVRSVSLWLIHPLLRKGGIFAVSHLSHYTEIHDRLAPEYAKKGITVSYDGMKIRL